MMSREGWWKNVKQVHLGILRIPTRVAQQLRASLTLLPLELTTPEKRL